MTALRPSAIFSLGQALDGGATSPLLAGGEIVGQVTGSRIDAQFTDGQHHVLLLTWDSPYEEELTILLLDSRFGVRDRRRLGGAWQPGILSDIVCRDGEIHFRFPLGQERVVSVRSTLLGPRLALSSPS